MIRLSVAAKVKQVTSYMAGQIGTNPVIRLFSAIIVFKIVTM